MSAAEEKYNKRRLRASYATTIISITLVLFMVGLLGLILLHGRKVSQSVKENLGFTIIIKEKVPEENILALKKRLELRPYSRSVEYITKEQAADLLKKELGEDFVSFIGYNPLLPTLELKVKAAYANVDSMAVLEKRLFATDLVKEVIYQKNLVGQINDNLEKVSIVMLSFSAILMIIAVTLVYNTIRLSIYAKRFLIRTMLLVGATHGFISRPFIRKGIGHGFLSAVIALMILSVVVFFVRDQLPEVVPLQDAEMFMVVTGGVILCGIIFSWISTYFAVRKYLRMKTDLLYF